MHFTVAMLPACDAARFGDGHGTATGGERI